MAVKVVDVEAGKALVTAFSVRSFTAGGSETAASSSTETGSETDSGKGRSEMASAKGTTSADAKAMLSSAWVDAIGGGKIFGSTEN